MTSEEREQVIRKAEETLASLTPSGRLDPGQSRKFVDLATAESQFLPPPWWAFWRRRGRARVVSLSPWWRRLAARVRAVLDRPRKARGGA